MARKSESPRDDVSDNRGLVTLVNNVIYYTGNLSLLRQDKIMTSL